jgi:hypothetical protein
MGMFVFKRLTAYGAQLILSAMLPFSLAVSPVYADDAPASMPTFSPIPPQTMLKGRGPEFSEQNYQLVSPLLRKCTNDWPSTRYVEFKPEVKRKVVIPTGPLSALSLLELLSQQTGRRFDVQRGIEQKTAVVLADGDEWTAVIKRFVRDTGLTFEAIQDIAIISDPASARSSKKPFYAIFALFGGLMLLGGFSWLRFSASRRKRESEFRGGWHDR